jgi:hypothetical protein
MTATTLITTLDGRTFEVKGRQQDIAATMKARTLSDDDGMRTLVLADGEEVTMARQFVALIAGAQQIKRNAIGFR